MATTPNFNWSTPDNTGLVKNGALDIRTLGNAIDASLVDLKGGTTGQVLAKASNTDMDFTWSTPSSGSSYVAGKNLIINGGFDIWQRGTGSIALGALGDYTADRWQGYRGAGGGGTVSRQVTGDTTNLPFIQYCARVQRASGNTSTATILFVNSSETVNSIPYAGKQVTFSFYARAGANFSATSSQLTVQLQTGTGTDQNALMTGYTGLTNAVNSTATLTTTWQRFTYTATLGATITEIAPYFTFAPTGTAGANDYYEITGVQVEIASSATAFSRNAGTIQGELAACQRYYYRMSPPPQYQRYAIGQCTSATSGVAHVVFPVTMRTGPSALEQTGTAGNYTALTANGGVVACNSVPTFDVATQYGGTFTFGVASGLVAGNATNFMGTVSTTNYLGWSAEL